MKALVVGLGSIGTRHLNNLCRLGVSNLSVFRRRGLPPPSDVIDKDVRIFKDYDKALEDGPEIVVIANPTAYHVSLATKALEAGSHVYIEKLLSHTLEGMERLVELAECEDRVVTVGCQFRFHPNIEAVKQWIQKETVGRIFSVYVDTGEYLPLWHPWEDYQQSYAAQAELGGGVVLTLIHELDYLYWLLGSMEEVYATGGHLTPLEIDVEDTALISLWSKEKVPIQLRMDYWRQPPVRKMHIVGEKGQIFWDYYLGQATVVQNGSVIEKSILPENWERNDLFFAIMKNFLDAIRNRVSVRVSLTDGVEVLKIALAAKASLLQKEVVHL